MAPAGSVDGRRLLLPADSARTPLGDWQGTFDPVDGSASALRYRFVVAAGAGRGATTDRAATVELTPLLVVAGAAFDADAVALARWRYVVETDIDPAAADDFNAWYDEEHLPGLAAVGGVVRAARFAVGLVGGEPASPRYLAAYDLADRDAFDSPAWRAVRGTAWSNRVRPSFRGTVRTMFARASV
ncbi:MAG: hypothetical protein ABWZ78_11545 [Burkholderiaceae bacterium]